MTTKKKLVVGISGMNAVDNPGPGVGVARSLKEDPALDVRVVGLCYDAMEPGIYMDWLVDRSFMVPYPSNNPEALFDRLAYIKHAYGLDFLLPTLDVELPVYIKYQEQLEKMGIHVFLPSMDQFKLRGKDLLPELAKNIGIHCPRTASVNSLDALVEALDTIQLPVMIKGVYYKAYYAYTTQEAIGHYHHVVAEWGYPVIVQEIIQGDELNLVGVGDGEGNSLGCVQIKKMWITALGKIWTGVSIKNQAMQDAAENFLKHYKWKSAFELECIVRDNELYLIEINPRFPAWSYFATGLGVNLPSNLIHSAMNWPVPQNMAYDAGKLFIRYTYELITDMLPFQKITTTGEV
ncbi:MAG: ATP-grasp domain-containing protein [SAR324 cluster bacterium]|nr:ATP-grasp domain-containing protein [SAR324 cluster bacterium]